MNDLTRYTPHSPLAAPTSLPTATSSFLTPLARPAERGPTPIVEWSADDQQALDSFEKVLKVSVPDNEVREGILDAARFWYLDLLRTTARSDRQDIATCIAQLKKEWRGDYPQHMKRLDELMSALPEEVAIAFYESRDGDGTLLLNNAQVANFLVTVKVLLDEPRGQARRNQTAATEREQMEAMMRNLNSDYWKGPRAAKLQARYRELLGE